MSKVTLRVVSKKGDVDNNNMIGTTLVGNGETVDLGLGTQIAEKRYWSKVDNSFEVGHVFEDVELDNFVQRQSDEPGSDVTFLYPKASAPAE